MNVPSSAEMRNDALTSRTALRSCVTVRFSKSGTLMYRENQYFLTGIYRYIFDMYQEVKSQQSTVKVKNSGIIFDIFG